MNKYLVHIPSPHISEALQKIAFENECQWSDSGKCIKYTELDKIYFDLDKGHLYTSAGYIEGYKDCPISEICAQLYHFGQKIKIGDHQVKFANDGSYIMVGCQRVCLEEVVKIYSRMLELKG